MPRACSFFAGIETKEIYDLIDSHPAFQQLDSSGVANPIVTERCEGVASFESGDDPSPTRRKIGAEGQFLQAIRLYDKDARYQYYLGFAMLQQKNRDKRAAALIAFEQGARLEAAAVQSNPFAIREINQSLERVQGEMRQLLNEYRYRPATEPETKKLETE